MRSAENISRLVRLEIAGSPAVPLVEYSHLGLGTVAIADFSSPRMKLDLTINSSGVTPNPSTGYSGTRYPGFDYRGRLNRATWTDYGYGPGSGSNYALHWRATPA